MPNPPRPSTLPVMYCLPNTQLFRNPRPFPRRRLSCPQDGQTASSEGSSFIHAKQICLGFITDCSFPVRLLWGSLILRSSSALRRGAPLPAGWHRYAADPAGSFHVSYRQERRGYCPTRPFSSSGLCDNTPRPIPAFPAPSAPSCAEPVNGSQKSTGIS